MGINFGFQIQNALFVEVIYPHPTRCMDDSVAFKEDTDMINFAFRILKKDEVAWLCHVYVPERLSLI